MSAADKNANRHCALNVLKSLFNGAILIFSLRGNARILACIRHSNLAEEGASPASTDLLLSICAPENRSSFYLSKPRHRRHITTKRSTIERCVSALLRIRFMEHLLLQ
tara:strand:+ start:412 stop:735 length:324 start_codon:yes stop_codon:yes gene_type:complete